MDIIETKYLGKVRAWVRDKSTDFRLNKRESEMVQLLSVLLEGCTPYLGYHEKVEEALAEFSEQMCR
jgi:hypothetical protein